VIADAPGLGDFLGVSGAKILRTWRQYRSPDEIDFPKDYLVRRIAPLASRGELRLGMVPSQGARVGRAYSILLRRFLSEFWDPNRAAPHSPSLERAISCLRARFA